MNKKEKMLALIKNKQSGGNQKMSMSQKMTQNSCLKDLKYIINKSNWIYGKLWSTFPWESAFFI